MNPPHIDTRTVREYLLGTLPEEETLALEDLYFSSPVVFNEIRKIEVELIRDYLDQTLAKDEIKRFESRYLTVPRLQALVQEVRARSTVEPLHPARWARPALVIAAAGCLVIVVLAVLSHRQKPVQVASKGTPPSVIEWELEPGLTKGSASQPEFFLPSTTAPLALIAVLPGERSSAEYTAQIVNVDREGRDSFVWSSPTATSVSHPRGQRVTFTLPSNSLSPGDYLLELRDSAGGLRERYLFRIQPAQAIKH